VCPTGMVFGFAGLKVRSYTETFTASNVASSSGFLSLPHCWMETENV